MIILSSKQDYNNKRTEPADYTRGIFQSIGFKEFHKYLVLNQEEKDTAEGRRLFEEGVEQLKLVSFTVDTVVSLYINLACMSVWSVCMHVHDFLPNYWR